MASVASTPSVTGVIRFSADYISNIPRYKQAIRRQPVMRWASARGLDEDLTQLALIDLARVDARFDPERATSPHHFRLAVLGSRVADCASALMRMYREVTGELDTDRDADVDSGEDDREVNDSGVRELGDPVLERAMRAQVARAVYAAVKALPYRQRQVIEFALEDLSDREIAAKFGISTQAVNKTRLSAIGNLKQVVLSQFPND